MVCLWRTSSSSRRERLALVRMRASWACSYTACNSAVLASISACNPRTASSNASLFTESLSSVIILFLRPSSVSSPRRYYCEEGKLCDERASLARRDSSHSSVCIRWRRIGSWAGRSASTNPSTFSRSSSNSMLSLPSNLASMRNCRV